LSASNGEDGVTQFGRWIVAASSKCEDAAEPVSMTETTTTSIEDSEGRERQARA
jgi:hypothetical protein